MNKLKNFVIIGSQFGDEGKGKVTDYLVNTLDVDIVCRFNGSNNAGHSINVNGKLYKFHMLPSCFLNPKCIAVIGNGCNINLRDLYYEICSLSQMTNQSIVSILDRLKISNRANIIIKNHLVIDNQNEKTQKLGTTLRGVGPSYTCKYARVGIRMIDLANQNTDITRTINYFKSLGFDRTQVTQSLSEESFILYWTIFEKCFCNIEYFLEKNKYATIIFEGANSSLLDIDFGMYPYVTSSTCTIGGVLSGTGTSIKNIGYIIGIVKAYTTRVGAGPFPTEFNSKEENTECKLLQFDEIGTTTGRIRRCGWLDLQIVKYATMLNGYDYLALTKLDALDGFDKIKIGVTYRYKGVVLDEYPCDLMILNNLQVDYITIDGWRSSTKNCKKFEDLPYNAQRYVEFIEHFLHVPISYIGVGKERMEMIVKSFN